MGEKYRSGRVDPRALSGEYCNSEPTTPFVLLYCEGNPKVETDNGLAEGDIVAIDAHQHWIRHLTFVQVEGIDAALHGD